MHKKILSAGFAMAWLWLLTALLVILPGCTAFHDNAVTTSSVSGNQVPAQQIGTKSDPYSPSCEMMLTDDFEDGAANGWGANVANKWTVVTDGGSKVYSQSDQSTAFYTYAGDSNWCDYAFSCRVKRNSADSDDRVRIYGRMNVSAMNFYSFEYYNGNIYIYKGIGGTATILASKAYTMTSGTWYNWQAVLKGATLEFWVNGNKELSVSDATFAKGVVGFGTYLANASFDDASVSGVILQSDDFEDGVADGWGVNAANKWAITTEGNTKIYSQSDESTAFYTYTGDSNWCDYALSSRVRRNSTGSDDYLRIYGRMDVAVMNFYYFEYHNGVLSINKATGGAGSTIVSKAYAMASGTWYSWKAVLKGSTLEFWVNGVKELSATDTSFSKGKAGYGTYLAKASFDDMAVTTPSYSTNSASSSSSSSSSASCGGILQSDDFEDGNSDGWAYNVAQKWEVVTDGNSKVYNQSDESTVFYTYTGNAIWSNYALSCRVKRNSTGADDYIRMYGRSDFAALNLYYFEYNNGNIKINKSVSGTGSTIASKAYAMTPGTWYNWTAVLNGAALEFWVNGVKELSATDATFSAGKVGFGTYLANASFDEMWVTVPSLSNAFSNTVTKVNVIADWQVNWDDYMVVQSNTILTVSNFVVTNIQSIVTNLLVSVNRLTNIQIITNYTPGLYSNDNALDCFNSIEESNEYVQIAQQIQQQYPMDNWFVTKSPGVNPSREEVIETCREIYRKFGIPVEIYLALLEQENHLKQYRSDGTPVHSGDGGYGMSQYTPSTAGFSDINMEDLKWDYRYNMFAGARHLLAMWNSAQHTRIGQRNKDILEDWYFALWRYNGNSGINNPHAYINGPHTWTVRGFTFTRTKAYQDVIYDNIQAAFGITVTPVSIDLLPLTGRPQPGNYDEPTPTHTTTYTGKDYPDFPGSHHNPFGYNFENYWLWPITGSENNSTMNSESVFSNYTGFGTSQDFCPGPERIYRIKLPWGGGIFAAQITNMKRNVYFRMYLLTNLDFINQDLQDPKTVPAGKTVAMSFGNVENQYLTNYIPGLYGTSAPVDLYLVVDTCPNSSWGGNYHLDFWFYPSAFCFFSSNYTVKINPDGTQEPLILPYQYSASEMFNECPQVGAPINVGNLVNYCYLNFTGLYTPAPYTYGAAKVLPQSFSQGVYNFEENLGYRIWAYTNINAANKMVRLYKYIKGYYSTNYWLSTNINDLIPLNAGYVRTEDEYYVLTNAKDNYIKF